MAESLKVHVLIDLEWKPEAGGQVMCWQHLARAASNTAGLQLTLHAQGTAEEKRTLHENVQLWLHKPVFSTKNIPLLHTPAHTDLAGFHPGLAKALADADVIHTTDGFFAYAQTAEKVSGQQGIPLVHSVHTDTISYSRIFTQSFLGKTFGPLGKLLDKGFSISKGVEKDMRKKLIRHESRCRYVLASREEDVQEAQKILGPSRARRYRLGVDGLTFHPGQRDRAGFCARHIIPGNPIIVLFVGRLDEGKNVMRLVEAMEVEIKKGAPLFLVAAGAGPKAEEIRSRLGLNVSLPGFLSPHELAVAYASCDWLALPSKVETWSLVVAEALSCGLPVMASSGSGVGRFLGVEGAGLLVEEDTNAAWEKALSTACTLQNSENLRAAAHKAALTHFPSWEQAFVQDFLPVWQEAGAA
jgi:glycosyltransferase involved in cell wall biosynthesis